MERGKIFRFPSDPERKARIDARARAEGISSGAVAELYPAPDLAKMVGIRRAIEEERKSRPELFTDENRRLTRIETEALPYGSVTREIAEATETMVHFDPIRYLALLERIESHTTTPQDDE